MMGADERARRVWRVIHRRRIEHGYEPVRRESDNRLIGWMRKPVEGNRRRIEYADGSEVNLVRQRVAYPAIDVVVMLDEDAWLLLDPIPPHESAPFIEPYIEEYNYDPLNPYRISTIPGEPNYSPTYPDPKL